MSRHDELRKTWREGDRWETRNEDSEQWVPVGNRGYAEPMWDERQEYRRVEEPGPVLPAATHRHIKSGGLYREVARGFLQTAVPLEDLCELVAYVGADGRMWFRPPSEFDDDERFAVLPDGAKETDHG